MCAIVLLSSCLLTTAPAPPIGLYDLTYALRFDAKDARQVARAWDHCHAVATLQGNVNREAANLYIRFVEAHGMNIDDYWLKRMSEPGQWLHDRPRELIPDILALVNAYRRFVKGVVVYDPNVGATSNLASTLAGIDELIAIRYDPDTDSLYSGLVTGGPRLPVVKWLLNENGSSIFTGKGTIPGTDIPSTGSSKCDAYLWLKHFYIDSGKLDATYAGYYLDQYWLRNPAAASPNHHTLTNHDFFVARRGFFFDLSIWGDETPVDDPGQRLGCDLATFKALLLSAYQRGGKERMIHIGGFTPWAYKYTNHAKAGGKHEGVATEWETSKIVSAYNGYIDADAIVFGAMANGSFFAHFPLRKEYPQKWITPEELRRRGYLASDGRVDFGGRQFIIFYVGDFDSAAWIYQWMPVLGDHPARGKVPMMWSISPVAERRAGMALDYMRRTATSNDYFVAADNGAGYLNPGSLQAPRPSSGLSSGVEAWARHCEPLYRRWGMTVTGFIIDGFAPGLKRDGLDAYARFSPNGIVPQDVPPSLLHGDMPVLRAGYDLGDSPEAAARTVVERVRLRAKLPFHWFRAVLKSPEWYEALYEKVRAAEPSIELLDAPTFFELYRIHLRATPEAAAGKLDIPR
ncbi:MAG: hypothetical protein KA354_20585 [Phycisphaerae bacterium]|nr:hypothetical protein [Phycisphaerae bacterium]